MQKKVINKKKDKILSLIIITLLAIGSGILIYKIATKNNLRIDSPIVNEIHTYFNTSDLSNCDGLFNYSNEKVTRSDISDSTKLCIAYQKSGIKDLEGDKDTLKVSKKSKTCKLDDMVFKADNDGEQCTYTKIEKSIISKTYKKIFGKDIKNDESFNVDNNTICYLKDDYYYCGASEVVTYILGNEAMIYRNIKSAKEKTGEIVIYDYFLKISTDVCYSYYTTPTTNESCTKNYSKLKDNKVNYKFLSNYGTLYKHVYKKNKTDNTYYWVSSEPIKK